MSTRRQPLGFVTPLNAFPSFGSSKPLRILQRVLVVIATVWLGLLASCHKWSQPPKPYLAFVANGQSNSVAVVDLARFHLEKNIPVSPGPEQLTLRPGAHEIYVTGDSGEVDVIEYPALRVVRTFKPGGPGGPGAAAGTLAFSADGRRGYVLEKIRGLALSGSDTRERAGGVLDVIDCAAGDRVSSLRVPEHPLSLALTPDGKTLIAADPSSGNIHFISAIDGKYLGSLYVGKGAGPLAVLPDSSKVFVADTGEDKVSSVDIASRQLLSNIEIGMRPRGLLVKPDGGELFVLSGDSATLVILDAFHDNVEQNLTTGREPIAAVIRRDQSALYIANAGDGSVSAFSVDDRMPLASVHLGTAPRALALTPDERFLVVADSSESSLAVLKADPKSLSDSRSALITTIPVGEGPTDVKVPDYLAKE